MTFKSIDLQMSVPRTQEYGGMQGQAIHKPVAEQNMLADQSAKHTERLRSKNTGVEQSAGLQVRSGNENRAGDGGAHKSEKRKRTAEEPDDSAGQQPVHPFKGHRLDIKL
ncbi:hypothetical protein [Paenibacillus arenilitoris]|uniref:Uncharacterized protein n=1 Tax=Paenibacillus arenilitoris TaxID=2772299 RepID=A0A927CR45_9BACL|nr:hypothetical protein [Paenibacillus arenilitoris]MBD2870711.1 hypothetical protein [Paenibacillus arenilitoris]